MMVGVAGREEVVFFGIGVQGGVFDRFFWYVGYH